jgi:hypothetical protein
LFGLQNIGSADAVVNRGLGPDSLTSNLTATTKGLLVRSSKTGVSGTDATFLAMRGSIEGVPRWQAGVTSNPLSEEL